MRPVVAWIALVAAGSFCACSHSNATIVSDAGSDASEDASEDAVGDALGDSTNDSLGDAGADAIDGTLEAAVPSGSLAGVRVANFSMTAPPFDVCFAAKGTNNWIGPMFATGTVDPTEDAQGIIANDGGGVGLGFAGVSSYFLLPPGEYQARWVAAGAPQCPSVGVVPDTTLPVLTPGRVETVAWFDPASVAGQGSVGEAGSPGLTSVWTITPFIDDVNVPTDSDALDGHFAVRFINAAPGVAQATLGYRIATGPVASLFMGVAYQGAGQPGETYSEGTPYVDGNGYLFVQQTPVLSTVISTSATGFAFVAQQIVQLQNVTLAAGPTTIGPGAVVTVVLLANNGSGDAGAGPYQLLQCVDNAGTLGVGGSCSLISQ
jgi:hypothetical protein